MIVSAQEPKTEMVETTDTQEVERLDGNLRSDHLQLAGSDLSLEEILKLEYTIPACGVKKDRFLITNVDEVFNTINGVLSSVSKEAVRKDIRLRELVEQVDTLTKERDQLATEKEYLVDQNAAMLEREEGYHKIIDELRNMVSDYVEKDTSTEHVTTLENQVSELSSENDQLREALGILYRQNAHLKTQLES